MGWCAFRRTVSYVLLFLLFPSAIQAADSNVAMLYAKGAAWVNGAHIPRSSFAIFAGDLLQTRFDSLANINETGSTVGVQPDSLVQFEGASVKIEHGGVTVSTTREMATTAGNVKVAPASSSWTEFNVVDIDGTVRITALKGDLLVSDGKDVVTLAQGQETTRDESSADTNQEGNKKKKKPVAGAIPAATGGILNSPVAVGIGGAAIGGLAVWVLVQPDDPASPAKP